MRQKLLAFGSWLITLTTISILASLGKIHAEPTHFCVYGGVLITTYLLRIYFAYIKIEERDQMTWRLITFLTFSMLFLTQVSSLKMSWHDFLNLCAFTLTFVIGELLFNKIIRVLRES